MTGFVTRTKPMPPGTLAVGTYSTQATKQVARARAKLRNRGLYKFAAELDGLAAPVSPARPLQRPVPGEVVRFARELLCMLPGDAPAPMLIADPQGDLTFQWSGANERALSIQVSPDGMLVYRGRLGTRRRVSGAEPIANDLPAIIRQALMQVRA